ncbi:MAG: autotransporter-associated beta strand repeat-containing protein, partial [Burkholderiaceae bacterium]|nr:autotransporter-associated beta strand repeat-containing protein [Burkholderiaceae bacterium]
MAVGFMGAQETSVAETCSVSYGGANSYIQKTNYFGSYVNEQNLNVTTCSIAFEWFGGGSTDEPPRGFVNEAGYTIELSGILNGPSDNRVLSFVNTNLDLFENKGTIIGTRGNGRLAMTMYGGSIKRFVNSGSFGNPDGNGGLYLSAANPIITELINTGTMNTAGSTIIVNRGSIDRIDNSGTMAASSSAVFTFNYPLARTTIIDNSGQIKRGGDPASTENIFAGLGGGPITKAIDFRNLQNGLVQGTINLGSANDLVTLYGGSTVTGNISGGTGIDGITLTGADGTHNLNITAFDTLTKTGSGTWTLAGTTSIESSIAVESGSISTTGTISAPSVTIADGSSLLIGTGNTSGWLEADTVTNSGILTFNRSNDYTFDASVSGAGELVHAGPATLTLGGNSTYSGQTTVSSGTLALTQNTSAGTSLIKLNDGTTLRADSAITLANQIAVSGSNVLDTQANAVTLNGAISGTGNLTKQGSGTITLGGNSNLTGTLTIAQGSLATGVENALSGTTNLTLASGTSANFNNLNQTIGALSGAGSIFLGTATLTTTSSNDTSFSGVISGGGGLTKSGTGTLTLSGVNIYTGATTVTAGTLATAGDNRLAAASSVVVEDGAMLVLGGDQTVGSFAGLGDIDIANHTLTTSVITDTTFSGGILGTGGELVLNGPTDKTLTLDGSGGFNGTVRVSGSRLALDSLNALGIYAVVELDNSATLEVRSNTVLGAVIGEVNSNTNQPNIISVNGAQLQSLLTITKADVLSAVLTDVLFEGQTYQAGLIKISDGSIGGGTSYIDAQEQYTGITAVNEGTLELRSNGELAAAGSLVMYEGGTFVLNPNKDQTFSSIAGAGGLIQVGNRTLGVNGEQDTSYGGVINGQGQFSKAGSSTLILSGANTFSGGTAIAGGVLAAANPDALGSGTITFQNSATLRADVDLDLAPQISIALNNIGTIDTQTQNVTVRGSISGDSLIKTGAGTLTLTNNNTYTGTTTVSGGTLALGQSASLGTSALSLADQTTLQADANLNLNNVVALNGTGTMATQGSNVSLSGIITGASGVLKKTGDGALTLSGANTYGGGTDLAEGSVIVGNDDALGAGTLTASGTGVKLQADSSVTLGNLIALSQDLIVDTNSQTLTLDGVASGSGKLIKQGAGTLALNASNTYRGGTSVSTGTLALGTGVAAGTGNIAMAANTTLQANSAMTVNNAITLAGATIISHQDKAVTLAGVIDGAGSLDKQGSGVLTLSGANSYRGTTRVSGGTLALGQADALGDGVVTLIDGTTLQANTAMTVANAISMTGTGTIATQDNNVTISGVISGTNLTKTGSGMLTLSNTNTYTGVTTINQGTLATSGDDKLAAASSVAIANGAKFILGGNQTVSSFEGAGDIDIGDHVLTTTMAQSTTFSGAFIGDAGQLTIDGPNSQRLRLEGDSSFSGKVLVNGATLALNSLNALGLYTVVELDQGAVLEIEKDTVLGAVIGEVNPNTNVPNIVEKNGAKLQSLLTITKSDTINVDITDVNFAGQIYQAGLVKVSDGSPDGGTSFIEAVEEYTGVTAVREGRLQLRGNGELASAGSLAMYESGVFGLNPDKDQAFSALSGSGGTIELGNRRLTINNSADNSYGGVINGDDGQFSKTGAGTLILSGTNTHTGGTFIGGGVLAAANARALGTGKITFESDATLRADVDLSLNSAIVLIDAGRIDTQSKSVTVAGQITGGALAKDGEGVLTLTNNNTYDGGTAVTSGTLALAASSAAGTGAISLGDQTTLQANTNLTLANAIDVLGSSVIATQANRVELSEPITGDSIVKTGSGTLVLSSDGNEYTGGTKLFEGTIVAASDEALGTGELTAAGQGVTLAAGKSELTLSNAIALSTDLIVDTAGEQVLLSGELSGSGKLIKQGAGTLELAGSNRYLGGTEVNEGVLALDADAAASTADVIMAADTTIKANTNLTLANVVDLLGPVTFDTQGFNMTLNGAVINNTGGQLIKTGTGRLTLNQTNTYTAGTVIEQGTLALFATLASGVDVQSGTTFGGTGTVTGEVSNAGTIIPRLN